MTVAQRSPDAFEFSVPVVIVGAGGCGMTAALAARDAGVEVLILERDRKALGTTSMSTGLIPAAGTPEQREQGIEDSPELFASDIQEKAEHGADLVVVERITRESAETIAWLQNSHGLPLTLVDGFLYPGHSVRRMFGMPNRSGEQLMAALTAAVASAGADLLTEATVRTIFVDGGRVTGVEFERPDGEREAVGCQALILACCGFAGDQAMVERLIPELKDAVFNGHPGAKGDAIRWGEELGAAIGDISSYQGHGGLAVGHNVPILWPTIMEGGVQLNLEGERFSDETEGYSQQAVRVLAQPSGIAWTVFDERIHRMMLQFDDYQQALEAGAVIELADLAELAERCRMPLAAVEASFAEIEAARASGKPDRFGRTFPESSRLAPPFRAARVTGALFHTQGGLEIDGDARVKREDGGLFPNLFAGGGAARGVSGAGAAGYMAGNGLLTATTLGKIAGRNAARLVTGS